GLLVISGIGILEYREQRTGELRWSAVLDAPWQVATPVCDGDRVYVLGLTGVLAAYRLSDGALDWKRQIPVDSNERFPYHRGLGGQLGSPVLSGDHLIIAGSEGTLRAFSRDGGPRWEASCGGPLCGTPIVAGSALYVPLAQGALQAWGTADDSGR